MPKPCFVVGLFQPRSMILIGKIYSLLIGRFEYRIKHQKGNLKEKLKWKIYNVMFVRFPGFGTRM